MNPLFYCFIPERNLTISLSVEGGVEGVAVGAILSDYQRVRVENVCARYSFVASFFRERRAIAILGIAHYYYMYISEPTKVITFILSFGIKWFPVVNSVLETKIDMKKFYGVNICVCVALLHGAPLPVSAKNDFPL